MYEDILKGVNPNSNPFTITEQPSIETPQQPAQQSGPLVASQVGGNGRETEIHEHIEGRKLFDVNDFVEDLNNNSEAKNRRYLRNANNINGYDIASNCIRQIIFKLLNYPVRSYKDVWLPVIMRAKLGNAVHDFIQSNSKSFTEWECSLKIPSINTSVRLDNLIHNNVLCEIKSCTYGDYAKILNSKKPRDADFYQVMFYRYLLMNHLKEAQSQPLSSLRSPPPKLPEYNIDTVQLIYAAHDLLSSDSVSPSDAIKQATVLKKMLNSKHNKFFYITTITLDLTVIDPAPYEAYIVEKLETINHCLANNIVPSRDNKFVNNECFFCLFKEVCKTT
jgi:hypothetical protein